MINSDPNSNDSNDGNSASRPQPCQLNSHYFIECGQERRQFEDDFLELQNPRSSSGRLLYVFVRRSLWQFHLSGFYSEACILNEAYIRGCELIEQGDAIRNTGAWLRQTSYNIIASGADMSGNRCL